MMLASRRQSNSDENDPGPVTPTKIPTKPPRIPGHVASLAFPSLHVSQDKLKLVQSQQTS